MSLANPIGYKRPPKETQWKNGQCGNPGGRRKRVPKGAAALIDEVWQEEVFVVEKGERRRVTVLGAILSQLMLQELSGDSRAAAARLQYQAFIYRRRGPQEIVCEYEYQFLGPEPGKEGKPE
jgi:Family of unknown function (DUF5681)